MNEEIYFWIEDVNGAKILRVTEAFEDAYAECETNADLLRLSIKKWEFVLNSFENGKRIHTTSGTLVRSAGLMD